MSLIFIISSIQQLIVKCRVSDGTDLPKRVGAVNNHTFIYVCY